MLRSNLHPRKSTNGDAGESDLVPAPDGREENSATHAITHSNFVVARNGNADEGVNNKVNLRTAVTEH